jgi:hypothetical protein
MRTNILTLGASLTAFLAVGSAQAALYIDMTEVRPDFANPYVDISIQGSVNTAAFAGTIDERPDSAGLFDIEGETFISGSKTSAGQVGPGYNRLMASTSVINWYPGSLFRFSNGPGADFGLDAFILERDLSRNGGNIVVHDGVRGVLSWPGLESFRFENTTLESLGVTAFEEAAGPYISTFTSNGVTDTLTFSFNGVGFVPEPSVNLLGGLAASVLLLRKRRSK